jgi:hypothetical protein
MNYCYTARIGNFKVLTYFVLRWNKESRYTVADNRVSNQRGGINTIRKEAVTLLVPVT